eukprot:4314265-Pleurochrysis_carterae.AAC.1
MVVYGHVYMFGIRRRNSARVHEAVLIPSLRSTYNEQRVGTVSVMSAASIQSYGQQAAEAAVKLW